MSMERFRICLADTVHIEGGYDDDPDDHGGQTMHGITHAEYDAWRRNHGLDPRPVRQLEQAELIAIYHDQYWAAVRADDLPIGVDRLVWDMGVNCGVGTSIRKLQMALGEKADGHLGQITLDAAHAADPDVLIDKFCAIMEARYRSLGEFWKFGRGWLSRLATDKKLAHGEAHQAHEAVVATAPIAAAFIMPAAEHEHDLAEGAATRARDAAPPSSMAESKTGNTALAVGSTGTGTLGVTAGKAAAAVTAAKTAPIFTLAWFGAVAIELMQTFEFWAAAAAVAGAAYVWLERRKKLQEHAL